jgi:hypothetical protein
MKRFAQKPKFVQTYKQTYKPCTSWVRGELLPAHLPHLNEGRMAEAIELRAAGHCLLDGKEYEFHDVRVYIDTSKPLETKS